MSLRMSNSPFNAQGKHHQRPRSATTGCLAPPPTTPPSTPIRVGDDPSPPADLPRPISEETSFQVPRVTTSCADCFDDELCPLHEFINEDYEFGSQSDIEAHPNCKGSTPRLGSLKNTKSRPKLRLQTPGRIKDRQLTADRSKDDSLVGIMKPQVRRQDTDDSVEDSLPSSSTLLGSGSTPGSGTKKWGKFPKTVKFASPHQKVDDKPISTPTRPLLKRSSSSQSSSNNSARTKMRRLFSFRKYPSDSAVDTRRSFLHRRHTEVTQLEIPRRISRLPSFFTRERLILPTRVQRRDVFLLSISLVLAGLFITVGVLAMTVPGDVCRLGWLATAIDSFLPNLAISTPYTLLVVGFAVSSTGRCWINGRYTPLLYALVAALGRVFVGALSGNISWKVMHCPGDIA